ncbi:MAG: CorA family divalent cation transporter [Alphaproteobacteria bacterium]
MPCGAGRASAEQLPHLQQEAEDFERDAAALSDRSRLLYEEIGSRLGLQQRAPSALTVISTLLLPPTFVVGAFGMNGASRAQAGHGFWAGLGLCLVLVLGGWALLRRFRILP